MIHDNRSLLYSTRNYVWYLIITYNDKNLKKNLYIYIYIHTHTHIYTHTHTHIYIYTHTHIYILYTRNNVSQLCCCCCSVTKSCLTLCNPVDCSTPGFPALHYLLELAQTHVHWVDDAIQAPHPLLPSSPPALIFPSIRVFSSELALLIRWSNIGGGASASALVLPVNIQGWFPLGLTG